MGSQLFYVWAFSFGIHLQRSLNYFSPGNAIGNVLHTLVVYVHSGNLNKVTFQEKFSEFLKNLLLLAVVPVGLLIFTGTALRQLGKIHSGQSGSSLFEPHWSFRKSPAEI
jgi:putative effector of murein hydrolase LrgA (UPF0299 family)